MAPSLALAMLIFICLSQAEKALHSETWSSGLKPGNCNNGHLSSPN